MGREAVAVCHWQGDVAEVKLHLDSAMLQLRGELRLDIPRAEIRDVLLCPQGARVITTGPELLMEMDPVAAGRWQKAILKKPPTLAEKLGISAAAPAFVLGTCADGPLADALHNATVADPAGAHILIAIVMAEPDLGAASDLALAYPDKHIWMVHRKGKGAIVGDAAVRGHMRDLGFVDSKTSAVSDQLTTTRYRLRAR